MAENNFKFLNSPSLDTDYFKREDGVICRELKWEAMSYYLGLVGVLFFFLWAKGAHATHGISERKTQNLLGR